MASHDQALRTLFDSSETDEAADDDSLKADAAETTNGQQTLTDVQHRFRHIVEVTKDQSKLDQHSGRWIRTWSLYNNVSSN